MNHDNHYQEIFINSDLEKFAHSVLKIQDFMGQLIKLASDSLFETEFSDENYEALMTDLKRIDSKIFEADSSHWLMILENIKWERDEERNNQHKS